MTGAPEATATRPLSVRAVTLGTGHINALGHLEAGRYVILFEEAIAPFFTAIGLTGGQLLHDTPEGQRLSPFLVEMHVSYLAELNPGDEISIAAQLLGRDARRAHLYLSMTKAPAGRPAAACELLILNMDVSTRRTANWSTAQDAAWQRLAAAQGLEPAPALAGRAIAPLR